MKFLGGFGKVLMGDEHGKNMVGGEGLEIGSLFDMYHHASMIWHECSEELLNNELLIYPLLLEAFQRKRKIIESSKYIFR